MALRLRALTDEERQTIERLAHARTAPARAVERARIVWLGHHGRPVPAIAQAVGVSQPTGRLWLKRFHAQGLDGLEDAGLTAPPATYKNTCLRPAPCSLSWPRQDPFAADGHQPTSPTVSPWDSIANGAVAPLAGQSVDGYALIPPPYYSGLSTALPSLTIL